MLIPDSDPDLSFTARGCSCIEPPRFGEALPVKRDRQRWGYELNAVTKAESALEPDTAKADGVKRSLVRIPKTTQGSEVFFGEILTIMLEDEDIIGDTHRSFGSSCVIGVLQ